MTRRTRQQIARDTIVDERAGVLALARLRGAAIDQVVARGKMDADEAALIKKTLNVFAGDIAIGLHIEGADDPEIRVAMRPIVKEMAGG